MNKRHGPPGGRTRRLIKCPETGQKYLKFNKTNTYFRTLNALS